MIPRVERGDIFLADLEPRSGSEQRGTRPVLIVSHDSFNRVSAWRSLIILPLTTSLKQSNRGPTMVHLPAGTAGLAKESNIIAHQVTTLDRAKLKTKLGHLPSSLMETVEVALKLAVGMA